MESTHTHRESETTHIARTKGQMWLIAYEGMVLLNLSVHILSALCMRGQALRRRISDVTRRHLPPYPVRSKTMSHIITRGLSE